MTRFYSIYDDRVKLNGGWFTKEHSPSTLEVGDWEDAAFLGSLPRKTERGMFMSCAFHRVNLDNTEWYNCDFVDCLFAGSQGRVNQKMITSGAKFVKCRFICTNVGIGYAWDMPSFPVVQLGDEHPTVFEDCEFTTPDGNVITDFEWIDYAFLRKLLRSERKAHARTVAAA